MRIKAHRHFMFSLIGWEKAKSKVEKAKFLDSGMRRNDGNPCSRDRKNRSLGQVATCPYQTTSTRHQTQNTRADTRVRPYSGNAKR